MNTTPAQRKAAERQRKARAGLNEVRGIWAPKTAHKAAKEAARAAIDKARP